MISGGPNTIMNNNNSASGNNLKIYEKQTAASRGKQVKSIVGEKNSSVSPDQKAMENRH